MTSREQFEAWISEEQGFHGIDLEWHHSRNCYAQFGIHLAWCAWQASRNVEIELPKPHAHLIWIQAGYAPDDFWDTVEVSHSEQDRCCDGSERYPVNARWEIEEALTTAGFKVKGDE